MKPLEEILRAKDGVLKEEGGSQKIAGKARRPYLNRSLVVKGGGCVGYLCLVGVCWAVLGGVYLVDSSRVVFCLGSRFGGRPRLPDH